MFLQKYLQHSKTLAIVDVFKVGAYDNLKYEVYFPITSLLYPSLLAPTMLDLKMPLKEAN